MVVPGTPVTIGTDDPEAGRGTVLVLLGVLLRIEG